MATSLLKTVVGPDGPLRRPAHEIAPSVGDLELMRVVAILQYLVGGVTLLVAAALIPDVDAYGNEAYLVLGGIAMTLALYRTVNTSSMTLAHARFSNLAGILFIAAIVAVSRPVGATPAFYLWPILTAAYFLRRRDLAVVCALFLVSLAVALWVFSDVHPPALVFAPLVLVVLVVTAIVRLMRESLAAQTADLERSATTDELTRLGNRALARRVLVREIDRARRIGSPLALMLFDLDHFKSVNDRLGHAGGDEALRRVAELTRQECRGGDLPARYGGEEFMVVMPDTGLREAIACAQRLRLRIEDATAADEAPLTVSVGVAILGPADHGPDDVIEAADSALYAAKGGGRNRVEVATRHASDLVAERI